MGLSSSVQSHEDSDAKLENNIVQANSLEENIHEKLVSFAGISSTVQSDEDGDAKLKNNIVPANSLDENLREKLISFAGLLNEEIIDTDGLRARASELGNWLENYVQLKNGENDRLSTVNDRLKNSNVTYRKQIGELKSQISIHQEIIDELTKDIKESQEKLRLELNQAAGAMKMLTNERIQLRQNEQPRNDQVNQLLFQISLREQTIDGLTREFKECKEKLKLESNQAAGAMKMLTNERKQSKEVKQTLKLQLSELKTNHSATKTALDNLKNRTETVSNQIVQKVAAVKQREHYFKMKFEILKGENDRTIKGLQTVTFTNRLYQSDLDALRKLQVETDQRSKGILNTIQTITKNSKDLIKEYNGLPGRFKKTIANHERDLNIFGLVDMTPQLAKEVALEESIFNHLSVEKQMLECILAAEKSNNLTEQVQNNNPKKSNNLTEQVQSKAQKKRARAKQNKKTEVQKDKLNNLDYTNDLGLNK